jgi:Xaa-Pro aminopeptidase
MLNMASIPFSIEEYINRQSRFHSKLPENSIVIIPTNPNCTRSNDTNYPFRGNSYMLYLCGWYDPDAVFVSHNIDGQWITSLFVQPSDTKAEIWEGRRVGVVNASINWPVDEAYPITEIDHIIQKNLEKSKNVFIIQGLNKQLDDIILESLTNKSRSRNKTGNGPRSVSDPSYLLDEMRLIKSKEEINKMQISCNLASKAHIKAITSSKPGIGEWEIQSIIEGHFISNLSEISYSSIVGGGSNATVLHYKNNNCVINDGELVLVDAGCEIDGYASDITRTWPINGKFTKEQIEIYEIVLEAEIAGINACVVGNSWLSSHHASSKVIAEGLIKLGILNCSLEEALGQDLDGPYRNFFMHGTSHSLGLDVHDVGVTSPNGEKDGRILEDGMVLTVEPGLYFADWRTDISIPSKYAGIGIRIEDDILITKDGPVILTSSCPKSIIEIESLMNKRS